jgi:hypothetical protein
MPVDHVRHVSYAGRSLAGSSQENARPVAEALDNATVHSNWRLRMARSTAAGRTPGASGPALLAGLPMNTQGWHICGTPPERPRLRRLPDAVRNLNAACARSSLQHAVRTSCGMLPSTSSVRPTCSPGTPRSRAASTSRTPHQLKAAGCASRTKARGLVSAALPRPAPRPSEPSYFSAARSPVG